MKNSTRFSIASLMLVVSMVAAGFWGYQKGLQLGDSRSAQEWSERMPEIQSYPLQSVNLDPEVESWAWPQGRARGKASLVTRLITEKVSPENWSALGGPYSVVHNDSQNELIVICSREMQAEVQKLITSVSGDSDRLTNFAKEVLNEQQEIHAKQRKWVQDHLEPAANRFGQEFRMFPAKGMLAGKYTIVGSQGFELTPTAIDFKSDAPDSWGQIRGIATFVYSGPGQQSSSKEFTFSPGSSILFMGQEEFVIGKGEDELVLVSRQSPSRMMVLSAVGDVSREPTDEREPE